MSEDSIDARCSAAQASRWPCPGSNRCRSGAAKSRPAAATRTSSQALRRAVHGQRDQPEPLVGAGVRRGMELSKSLQPLAPFEDQAERRLRPVQQARDGGRHPSGPDGQHPLGRGAQKGAVLKGGVSMDQVLAGRLGEETPQPSLVLGCEQPITGYHESNFSMAYSSHISWQDALSPVPMEVYPSLAFDSLFDNQGSRAPRASSTASRRRPPSSAARSAGPTGRSSTST